MSKNTINFQKRTYDEIFLSLLIDGYKEGLLSTDTDFIDYIQNTEDIENILILDYSIIAYQLSIFYQDAEKIYQSKDLNLAVGVDLDNIGKEKGITRPKASYPETLVTFYRKTEGSNEIIIPKGTRIGNYKTNTPIYQTLETKSIPSLKNENDNFTINGKTYPYTQINCRCQTPGYDGRVNTGELTEIIDNFTAQDTVYCINTKGSSGGRPEYNDEKYRELLKKWAKVFQRGNLNCYIDYLERLDGIDSYFIIPKWNYPGTIKIVVDPPTIELINRIQEDCQNIIGLCKEAITVVGAKEKNISINCICNVDIDEIIPYSQVQKDNIAEKVKQAIYEYIMGYEDNIENIHYTGLLIGQDFIPYKCGVYVGDKIKEIKDISFLNTNTPYETDTNGKTIYNPANNIPIASEEIATVNLDDIYVTVQ